MNADGTGVGRLTTTGARSLVWSPDGSKVAFVSISREPGSSFNWLQVFVADPGGGNVTTVTKDPQSPFDPCWSAGGSIAYVVDNVVSSNIFQIDPTAALANA